MRRDVQHATILMSHTHWDHINGFPFFAPAFNAGYSFDVMAGHLSDDQGIREVLAGQMAQPMFPVPIEAMRIYVEILSADPVHQVKAASRLCELRGRDT